MAAANFPISLKMVLGLSDQSVKRLFNMQTHKAVRHPVRWDAGTLGWKRHHEIDDRGHVSGLLRRSHSA